MQIYKLRFGHKAKFLFRLLGQGLVQIFDLKFRQDFAQGLVKILKLKFRQDLARGLVKIIRLKFRQDFEAEVWPVSCC